MQPRRRVADRQRRQLGDGAAADRDGEDLRLEPGALARGTRHLAHVALVLLARIVALRLGVAPFDPRDDALVAGVVRAVAPVAIAVVDVHLLRETVQDRLLRPGGQLVPGRVEIEALDVGDTLKQPLEVLVGLPVCPGCDRAFRDAALRVGDDQLRIDLLASAQAGALGAGPERRVERERARLQLVDGQRVIRCLLDALAVSRSTTASMVCFSCFFSLGGSVSGWTTPSTRTRA